MRRALYALSALPVLYLCAALIGALIPGPRTAHDGQGTIRVGLVSGPIHYDFVLPLTPETRATLGFTETGGVPMRHPGAQWLIVG